MDNCSTYIDSFRFWCQKVLPTVYDDSLSYYEVLCKLADGFNHLLQLENENSEAIQSLQQAMAVVQQEIEDLKNGKYTSLQKIIENAIKSVYFGITQAGYFVAYIPDNWGDIVFGTTGLDVEISGYDYGHLVLAMNVENPTWGPNYNSNVVLPTK